MSQVINRVPVNLSELLGEDVRLPADLVVTSFQTDPAQIEAGELFVCLADDGDAAAAQLETAKARGARASLVGGGPNPSPTAFTGSKTFARFPGGLLRPSTISPPPS